MESGLDRLLRESDFALHPELQELRLLNEARALPSRRIRAFTEIAGSRGRRGAPPDLGRLLHQLWPQSSWTSIEAREALTIVDTQHIDSAEVIEWLAAALLRPQPGNDLRDRDEYLRLCREVGKHRVQGLLPAPAQAVLATVKRVQEVLGRTPGSRDQAAGAVSQLVPELTGAPPPFIRELLLERLPRLLLRLDAPRL